MERTGNSWRCSAINTSLTLHPGEVRDRFLGCRTPRGPAPISASTTRPRSGLCRCNRPRHAFCVTHRANRHSPETLRNQRASCAALTHHNALDLIAEIDLVQTGLLPQFREEGTSTSGGCSPAKSLRYYVYPFPPLCNETREPRLLLGRTRCAGQQDWGYSWPSVSGPDPKNGTHSTL